MLAQALLPMHLVRQVDPGRLQRLQSGEGALGQIDGTELELHRFWIVFAAQMLQHPRGQERDVVLKRVLRQRASGAASYTRCGELQHAGMDNIAGGHVLKLKRQGPAACSSTKSGDACAHHWYRPSVCMTAASTDVPRMILSPVARSALQMGRTMNLSSILRPWRACAAGIMKLHGTRLSHAFIASFCFIVVAAAR